MNNTISYVSSGQLGDFIHQLSVINEIYIKSGRKGILYISEQDSPFRFGIKKAYDDTYDIITSQDYIKEYKIYHGEHIDINLSYWRNFPNIHQNTNWYEIFKQFYNVEWGTHPWLKFTKNEKWKDKVLINTTITRNIYNIDFKDIYEKHGLSLLFITNNINDYFHFKKYYNIDIECEIINSLPETCIAIASCKMFIGSLSAYLTIAHAVHDVPHIIGLSDCQDEINRMSNLQTYICSIVY